MRNEKGGNGLRHADKRQARLRDTRRGAYDPAGPARVFDPGEGKATERQRLQPGADVRQGTPRPRRERPQGPLPEGLSRPRKGPYDKNRGRGGHGE
ncbi:MAG: hypothetical protein ACJ8F3_17295 [Xanthobacteraceae bacterium]